MSIIYSYKIIIDLGTKVYNILEKNEKLRKKNDLFYLVSENFSDKPKSWVVVG